MSILLKLVFPQFVYPILSNFTAETEEFHFTDDKCSEDWKQIVSGIQKKPLDVRKGALCFAQCLSMVLLGFFNIAAKAVFITGVQQGITRHIKLWTLDPPVYTAQHQNWNILYHCMLDTWKGESCEVRAKDGHQLKTVSWEPDSFHAIYKFLRTWQIYLTFILVQ